MYQRSEALQFALVVVEALHHDFEHAFGAGLLAQNPITIQLLEAMFFPRIEMTLQELRADAFEQVELLHSMINLAGRQAQPDRLQRLARRGAEGDFDVFALAALS